MGSGSSLPPWVLQVFGIAIICVFVIVKIQTGQDSTYLVGVGAFFAIGGSAKAAWDRLRRELYKGLREEEDHKGPPG